MEEPIVNQAESVAPASVPNKEKKQKLSHAERQKLAAEAAHARWGKPGAKKRAKTAKAHLREASLPASTRRASIAERRSSKVFGIALTAAEKSYAKSLEELAYHENMVAILKARIPSLERTIAALQNQQNPTAFAPQSSPSPWAVPSQPGFAPIPQPHPHVTRAQGGAVGVNLADETDEDAFLKDSAVAEGNWH